MTRDRSAYNVEVNPYMVVVLTLYNVNHKVYNNNNTLYNVNHKTPQERPIL